MATKHEPLVFIVDDDAAIRDSLATLLETEQIRTQVHSTPADFLDHFKPAKQSCLVLDARLPGMSGIDLLDQLADSNVELPVIMITGHGDAELIDAATRRGVVRCLEKPFLAADILASIRKAIPLNEAGETQDEPA